jgi:hypothetical protein
MTEPLTSADHLTPAQRAAEITQILTAAIRRSTTATAHQKEGFGLGYLPDRRGNVAPHPTERKS